MSTLPISVGLRLFLVGAFPFLFMNCAPNKADSTPEARPEVYLNQVPFKDHPNRSASEQAGGRLDLRRNDGIMLPPELFPVQLLYDDPVMNYIETIEVGRDST